MFFAGILTWGVHAELEVGGWLLSALFAVSATVLCGGSALLLIGMLMRSSYRRLCWLSIPRNGDDLELDSPEDPSAESADLAEGLKLAFLGETKRQQLTIPREVVSAVQLCPWNFACGSEVTWAVQGLLVLACSADGTYYRLPILLTSDFVGAARLMQRLAATLHVPYLFCADAEGWKAEEIRARAPPLRIGGTR